MAYYVRKISRGKWQSEALNSDPQKAVEEVRNVKADTITSDLRTTSNKLSLWKVDSISNDIKDVIPLIVGFDKPDNCDIVYISEDDLKKEGFVVDPSSEDANTPLEQYKETHYNAIVANYEGLGSFAKVVLKSLTTYKRFKEREVKTKLKSMLDGHEIEKTMISDNLYEKLQPKNN